MDSIPRGPGHCSVCREEGETTLAQHWCSECEAFFCDQCLKQHGKMPVSKRHKVVNYLGKKLPRKRKFICSEHKENMNLFCKDCNKPLCTVCFSMYHRTCRSKVITMKTQMTVIKSKLHESQQNLIENIHLTNDQIEHIDTQTKHLWAERSMLESDIRKTIKEAICALKQKEDMLIEKVKDQTEQDKEQLRSMMESKQMDLQLYQQRSQSIQQALELEDEVQLFEMYLRSGSIADVTGTQRKDIKYVAEISFKHDLDQLKEQIEMMDVMINKVDLNIQHIDLTAAPVLDEVIDAKLDMNDSCNVRDCLIMNIAGRKVTVFADSYSDSLKSYYYKEGQSCSSVLKLSSDAWCLLFISEGKVAASLPLTYGVPESQCIIIVAVTPDLELLSTLRTSKNYWGLSTLDQSTLVAGSDNPSSVDLIDMKGTILKTIASLFFVYPRYIHVTRQGTILVSDTGTKSIICLTRSGEIVFICKPPGNKALGYSLGITSTSTGDILVSDCDTHKVIHLSQSGEYVGDILTEEDGILAPTGLCIEGDKLCVTLKCKGLHKYRFG